MKIAKSSYSVERMKKEFMDIEKLGDVCYHIGKALKK